MGADRADKPGLIKDLIAAGPGGGKGGNPPAVTRLAWVAMHS